MGLFSRFFGRAEDDDTGSQLQANPEIKDPLSLQVLFAGRPKLDPQRVTAALRSYHPSMARARCDLDPELNQEGKMFGLAGWGNHVIRLVGFDTPMPAESVEAGVAPSHYPQALKQQARAHAAHLLLFYAGHDPDPLEQYVALAAVAGVMAQFGALVVLNEAARTSLPAGVLSGEDVEGDMLGILRTFPLPMLFCGFVKYNLEGSDRVWMRTYGAHLFGISDLAALAEGHHEGQKYLDIFGNILAYLRESGARIEPGHTLQIEQEEFLRFRGPRDDEPWLESKGALLVAEPIGPDEINRG